MTFPDHPPLDLRTILVDLDRHRVRWVLTGSVAAAAYGVPVEPRDIDVTPELGRPNLERLAALLADWEARPLHVPAWKGGPSREECDRWRPAPATADQLDHLMVTRHGLIDIVPRVAGRYTDLIGRSLPCRTGGLVIQVAHLENLIATMRPHQPKHARRMPYLEALRARARERTLEPSLPVTG